MQAYLDWRLPATRDWLRELWPAAKSAIEFGWVPGGWDADRDGVMEGVQHNTYDVEFYGPNPLCGIYYLGGLRAAEEMARAVGDTATPLSAAQPFERGSRWIDANLFNGEYYIQKIRGIPKDQIAKALADGMGAADTENPEYQAGRGLPGRSARRPVPRAVCRARHAARRQKDPRRRSNRSTATTTSRICSGTTPCSASSR